MRTRNGSALAVLFCLILLPWLAWAQSYPSLATAPQLQKTGQGDAVILVGVGEYAFLPPVEGVVETINDWENFFVQGLGVPSERVFTLMDRRATRERMMAFAERVTDAVEEGGTVWFVFVGHGAPTISGEDGVLVGVDAQSEPSSLEGRGVSRRELVGILEGGPQARTLVFIDACFSGRAGQGQALAQGMQPVIPARQSEFRPAASTLIVSAAQSDEFAGALPGARRPAFSYVTLGALRGWATASEDVTASEMVHFVRQTLRHLDHSQTPQLDGDGDVVLVRGAREESPNLAALFREQHNAPAPTPVSQTGPGILHVINVTPSPVRVVIDGEEAGVAPGQVTMPAGRDVEVQLQATGYEPWQSRLKVDGDEVLQLRDISLEPLPATLSIRANVHGAEVMIEDRTIGQTRINNAVLLEAPAGEHTLSLRLEGYETFETEISLAPGSTMPLEVELEPFRQSAESDDAATRFQELEKKFAAWKEIEIKGSLSEQERLLREKVNGAEHLQSEYGAFLDQGDLSLREAGLFRRADILLQLADSIFDIQNPFEEGSDEFWVYVDMLDDIAFPLENQAIETLDQLLDHFISQERFESPWFGETLAQVASYSPRKWEQFISPRIEGLDSLKAQCKARVQRQWPGVEVHAGIAAVDLTIEERRGQVVVSAVRIETTPHPWRNEASGELQRCLAEGAKNRSVDLPSLDRALRHSISVAIPAN